MPLALRVAARKHAQQLFTLALADLLTGVSAFKFLMRYLLGICLSALWSMLLHIVDPFSGRVNG